MLERYLSSDCVKELEGSSFELMKSSFEMTFQGDPSRSLFTSKDHPSKSSFEVMLYPSTKTCCLGINTHVLASFEADL